MATTEHLPGTTEPSIVELDKAVDAYQEAKVARVRLGNEEKQERDKLHTLMKKHGRKQYRSSDGLVARIVHEAEKVIVEKMKDHGDGKRKRGRKRRED